MIEAVAVILMVIVLLVILFLVISEPPRITPHQMTSQSYLRSIHQGLIIYAQSNKSGGGVGYYPGLDQQGNILPDGPLTDHLGDGAQPHVRLWLTLKANVMAGNTESFIARRDTARTPWDPTQQKPFGRDHFSYALLNITGPDGEAAEWKETGNNQAVVLSDRAIGTGHADLSSIWTDPGSGHWEGTVVRNDGSASYEQTHIIPNTSYGRRSSTPFPADDLFLDTHGTRDAVMVHEDATTVFSRD